MSMTSNNYYKWKRLVGSLISLGALLYALVVEKLSNYLEMYVFGWLPWSSNNKQWLQLISRYIIFCIVGSSNNFIMLDCSHLFDDILRGNTPTINYTVNDNNYTMWYYLTDVFILNGKYL